MKPLLLAIAVFAGITGAALADHGTTDFVKTGSILVGSPTTAALDTATLTGPCLASRNAPNVDSDWVTLPEGSAGHAFSLTATDDMGLADVDVYFVDAECNFLVEDHENVDGNEAGTVPEGATQVDIALFFGVNATYTLTVEKVLP